MTSLLVMTNWSSSRGDPIYLIIKLKAQPTLNKPDRVKLRLCEQYNLDTNNVQDCSCTYFGSYEAVYCSNLKTVVYKLNRYYSQCSLNHLVESPKSACSTGTASSTGYEPGCVTSSCIIFILILYLMFFLLVYIYAYYFLFLNAQSLLKDFQKRQL